MKLPKSESLILLVFIGCIALWGVSKCSDMRSDAVRRVRDLSEGDHEDRPIRRDTVVLAPAPAAPVNAERPAAPLPVQHSAPVSATAPTSAPRSTTTAPTPTPRSATTTPTSGTAPAGNAAAPKYSTLYVTIDGLKLRKSPSLKGEVIATLALYEAVQFMNKKSEKPEEISLGYEKVTDHWVKVRTQAGKEGWVFGAGVHYYKTKRKGVME